MMMSALGLRGSYIQSPWWGLTAQFFDVEADATDGRPAASQ